MKRTHFVSLLLPVIISGALLSAGCRHSPPSSGGRSDRPTQGVTVAVVGRTPRLEHVEQAGTVMARHHADIETKVQARVERIRVAVGMRVRRGDLLAELDMRELHARRQQAQAVLEQATQESARYETLLARHVVSQQEYDGVKARLGVAAAALAEAEATLSYAQITAPFAGTVTDRIINVGDLAIPGRPLFTLEDEASLQLVTAVPEAYRDRVGLGDTLPVSVPASGISDSGIVDELSPSADPASRTFVVKLALPDRPGLRAGQHGHLLIPMPEEKTISMPLSALVRRGQLELVYVAGDDHRAALRLIRSGRQSSDVVEVLSGLREGERVILEPPAGLSDGDTIEERS